MKGKQPYLTWVGMGGVGGVGSGSPGDPESPLGVTLPFLWRRMVFAAEQLCAVKSNGWCLFPPASIFALCLWFQLFYYIVLELLESVS